jgi:hypothetical protein
MPEVYFSLVGKPVGRFSDKVFCLNVPTTMPVKRTSAYQVSPMIASHTIWV